MVKKQKDAGTQQRILEAARKVFLEKGMAGARMQDIADEAGINKALLHYYFTSKDMLFEQIFANTSQTFVPHINEIIESDMPLFEKIEHICDDYISMLIKNPYMPLFLINEINKQDGDFLKRMWGKQKANLSFFVAQIQKEVKKGTIKPIHPAQLYMNIMSMCVFPFLGKPMMQFMTKVTDKEFVQLMEERKTFVARFVIDSIRK
ncbi:MAG: TetR/AcrR family transcriptional regulator [Chitinophagaceae bacterium]|nr:TetR/AcrR family transcriptional regulator [Chitinophagaceae bacterium]